MPNIAHYSHDTTHETEKPHSKDSTGNYGNKKDGKPKKTRRQKIFPKPLCKVKAIDLLDNKPKAFPAPLYHLQGRQLQRYLTLDNIVEKNTFEVALEVLNRRGVRKVRKPCPVTNEISQYFFECIGNVQISCRMCVVCRDTHKEHATDRYFVDLVEISEERRVLCLNCMINLVNSQVTSESHITQNELNLLRTQQPRGVYIDPFLITCGY